MANYTVQATFTIGVQCEGPEEADAVISGLLAQGITAVKHTHQPNLVVWSSRSEEEYRQIKEALEELGVTKT